MVYLSLVGTQVMAVLNPLLSLIFNNQRPQQVELLATCGPRGTLSKAKTIKRYLVNNEGFADVGVHAISDSLKTDSENRPPAQIMTENIIRMNDDADLAFNLAGGMNFQTAACMDKMNLEKTIFIYPESTGIHAIRIADETARHDKYCLPKPIDVLRLQGVPYKIKSDTGGNRHLISVINHCRISLPPDAVKNVLIKNVLFDFVWNQGNELRFLKSLIYKKNDAKAADFYRLESRKLIDLAMDRTAFGELFHRPIMVVSTKQVAERLTTQSAGKIKGIVYSRKKFPCSDFKRIFEPAVSPEITIPADHEIAATLHTDIKGINKKALYVIIGKDITATLIALWSHVISEVCFIYTPGDPDVEKYRRAILTHRGLLPVKKVAFYPAGITGTEILQLPLIFEDVPRRETNVTPGTKGQGAFLAVWGRQHGAHSYSIETSTQKLTNLHTGEGLHLKGPDPETFLKLKGERIIEKGRDKKGILSVKQTYEAALTFLKDMCNEEKDIRIFPDKGIWLRQAMLIREGDKAIRQFDEGRKFKLLLRSDIWYEELIGYLMVKCGADDVNIRLRTGWDKETEAEIKSRRQNINGRLFKDDIDVVARFNGAYYVIECKSGKKKNIGNHIANISGVSKLFGRFAVPLISFFQYKGDPYMHQGVYIFGYKTLLNTVAMKDLLTQAFIEKGKNALK